MLACLGTPNGELVVLRVGQHDVNHLHLGVVLELVVVGIRVAAAGLNAVLLSGFSHFIGVAAHQGHRLAVLGLAEGGQNLGEREVAQAHDGVAHALVGRIGVGKGAGLGVGGCFEGRQLDIERASGRRGGIEAT